MSETSKYTLYGLLFGLCFPIGSIAFLHFYHGHTHALNLGGLWDCIAAAHADDPLLWVVDTAPIFLGLFARLAGIRQERIRRLTSGLEHEVLEKTESLRRALADAQKANETIAYMAEHDGLTGLLNRRRFQEELKRWIEHARRYQRGLALMFVDLDHLKRVNDEYGHGAGDRYLLQVAETLRRTFRSTDFLARWGGDEFAVLLPEASEHEAVAAATKLLDQLRGERLVIGDQKVEISASVGLALAPTPATDADMLVRDADAAMYAAKQAGRGCWRMYSGEAAASPAPAPN